jgi:Tol biopolymer transport system component
MPFASGRPVVVGLAAATLVLLLVIAAVVLVGSRPRLPPPFGPAANGLIAFDTGRGGGVWLANNDGSDPRRIVGEGIERTPSFSPNGTMLAFWSRPNPETDISLFVANADGSAPHRIAPTQRFVTDPAYAAWWAPDSARLTFSSYGPDGVGRIWVVSIDGSPAVPITSQVASRINPSWSPDGAWIVFNELSRQTPSTHAISIVHPDGSDLRVLHAQRILGSVDTEAGFGETFRWSPDSRRIAYNRGKDPGRPSEMDATAQYLAVVDIDRPESDHVVYDEGGGSLHFPVWSPDGRSLAFVVGEAGNAIHVVDPDGAADRIVGRCPVPIESLAWSPDGKWLTMGCPDGAELRPAAGSDGDPGVPLDDRSRAIDIQRVAP